MLETLDPKALLLPDRLLDLIPPQAFNRPEGTAERFTGKTGLLFDPIAAAVTAADLAVSGMLNPQRARVWSSFTPGTRGSPASTRWWPHSSRRPGKMRRTRVAPGTLRGGAMARRHPADRTGER